MPTNGRFLLFRRVLAIALLGAGMCGLFSACSTVHAPTYTDAELQAQCERRGGWWRGSLIAGLLRVPDGVQAEPLTDAFAPDGIALVRRNRHSRATLGVLANGVR